MGSLASMATVSEFGFVTTPYRVVEKGKVSEKIVYLDAAEEEKFHDRTGERAGRREDRHVRERRRPVPRALRRRAVKRAARRRRLHGRQPGADRLGRDGADPVLEPTTPTARSWARICSGRLCR
jgi:hypothetical protein